MLEFWETNPSTLHEELQLWNLSAPITQQLVNKPLAELPLSVGLMRPKIVGLGLATGSNTFISLPWPWSIIWYRLPSMWRGSTNWMYTISCEMSFKVTLISILDAFADKNTLAVNTCQFSSVPGKIGSKNFSCSYSSRFVWSALLFQAEMTERCDVLRTRVHGRHDAAPQILARGLEHTWSLPG